MASQLLRFENSNPVWYYNQIQTHRHISRRHRFLNILLVIIIHVVAYHCSMWNKRWNLIDTRTHPLCSIPSVLARFRKAELLLTIWIFAFQTEMGFMHFCSFSVDHLNPRPGLPFSPSYGSCRASCMGLNQIEPSWPVLLVHYHISYGVVVKKRLQKPWAIAFVLRSDSSSLEPGLAWLVVAVHWNR